MSEAQIKASGSRAEWARCGSRSGRAQMAPGGPEIVPKWREKPPEGLEQQSGMPFHRYGHRDLEDRMVSLGLWARQGPAGLRHLDLQSFQVMVGCRAYLWFWRVSRQSMIRPLLRAGWTDLYSWLNLDTCQGQPAPVFSFQTTSPLPARTRIGLFLSTFTPGLSLLFQAHSLRSRFCWLLESSDLNGEN